MNPQKLDDNKEQARAAFMATLAAARNNPDGELIVQELTRILGGIEGIGGDLDPARLADALMVNGGGTSDEHGNPIVEITETMDSMSIQDPTGTTFSATDFERWDDMTPEAREARKKQYDSMWELLEQEEQDFKRRPPQASKVSSEDPAKPSMSEPPVPIAPPPPPTPIRSSLTTTSNQENKPASARPLKRTKSVKFADGTAPVRDPSTPAAAEEPVEWGDVIPATLRQKNYARSPQTMKPKVVERIPGAAQPTSGTRTTVDSDDEDEVPTGASNSEPDGEGDEFDPGEDMEVAALQREVALDYLAKRDDLRQQADQHGISTAAFSSRIQQLGENAWDQEFVPIEASLAAQPSKSSESRFRASRLANSQPSTMSVPVQAVGAQHFATPIKEGKLVDGQLVAPADSDDDDEIGEAGKRLIEKLRAREELNEAVASPPTLPQSSASASSTMASKEGPSFAKLRQPIIVGEIKERSTTASSTSVPSASTSTAQPTNPAYRPQKRPSRFMATQHIVGSVTPPSAALRSSPKLSAATTPTTAGPPSVGSAKPSIPKSVGKSAIPQSASSKVVDSPSFPLPEGFEELMASANVSSDMLSSNILISPSFQPPSATSSQPAFFNPESVMKRDIQENRPTDASNTDSPPKRISRFKAERM